MSSTPRGIAASCTNLAGKMPAAPLRDSCSTIYCPLETLERRELLSDWTEVGSLLASDPAAIEHFGAAVDVSGDWAIVGAPQDSPPAGSYVGSAAIFHRVGTTWTLSADLKLPDGVNNDDFGVSVAIQGNVAVVGADGDPDFQSGVTKAGAIYVYTFDGSQWTLAQELQASDGAADDMFGRSVDIDGSYMVVGAMQANLPGTPAIYHAGAAYVFHYDGSTWTQQNKLTADDATESANFGGSTSISGNDVIVGAELMADPFVGANAGQAYIFHRSGTDWAQTAILANPAPAAGVQFGNDVAIVGDTAVVADSWDTTPGGVNGGSVYIYQRNGDAWDFSARLLASDDAAGKCFGGSIAMSADTIVVSSWYTPSLPIQTTAGSVYVFQNSGGSWQEQVKITLPGSSPQDGFGSGVAIDGSTLLAGALNRDVAGEAIVCFGSGENWTVQQELLPLRPQTDNRLGSAMAIDGTFAVVGAPGHAGTGGTQDAGAAYFYEKIGGNWQLKEPFFGQAGEAPQYGTAVAISSYGDSGEWVFVGSPGGTGNSGPTGAVYIYRNDGSGWTLTQMISPADPSSGQFGCSVAIDGNLAVVGAASADPNGAAYVYQLSFDIDQENWLWSQVGQLVPQGATNAEAFGTSVDISGGVVVVGAPMAGDSHAGAAYIFTRKAATWGQAARITAPGGAGGDHFGQAVAISGGNLLVGADTRDSGGLTDSGAVYAFTGSGAKWTPAAVALTAADAAAGDHFGGSIALDGAMALIGANQSDGTGAGAVYRFEKGAAWTQTQKLTPSVGAAGDQFGSAVALDGSDAMVGSPLNDRADGADAGTTFLFTGEVPLPLDAKGRAKFTDESGDVVSVTLSGGGTGTLYFDHGGNADALRLELTGTTDKSSLTITTRGKGSATTLGRLEVESGSLKRFTAKTTTIATDGIYATTALDNTGGYILSISVADLTGGAQISLPGTGAAKGVTIVAGWLDGTTIVSGSGIKSLSVWQWDGGQLTAPWAGSISVKGNKKRAVPLAGNLSADLTLQDKNAKLVALGKLAVAGTVSGTQIEATSGSVGAVSAGAWDGGQVDALWMTSLKTKLNCNLNLNLTSASIKGVSLAKGTIGGNLSGQWDILGGDLGTLTVAGQMNGTEVSVAGNVKSVTVGQMLDSYLLAGAADGLTSFPATADNLPGGKTIGTFTVKGIKGLAVDAGMFVDSFVAASTLGKITLRNVNTDNPTFIGLAAVMPIANLTIYTDGKVSEKFSAIADSLVPDGSFHVDIL